MQKIVLFLSLKTDVVVILPKASFQHLEITVPACQILGHSHITVVCVQLLCQESKRWLSQELVPTGTCHVALDLCLFRPK